jgi:hypothetical protein
VPQSHSEPFGAILIDHDHNGSGVNDGGLYRCKKLESPIDEAVVILAGWFSQEGHTQVLPDGKHLREAVSRKVEDGNGDCTKDINDVLGSEPSAGPLRDQFWQDISERFANLWVDASPRVDALARLLQDARRRNVLYAHEALKAVHPEREAEKKAEQEKLRTKRIEDLKTREK